MPTFPLVGEPLLCSFCLLSVGPSESAENKSTPAGLGVPGLFSPICRAVKGFATFVLQRYSSLRLYAVGKLSVKSKLDSLYVMAEFDGRAQF